LQKKGLKRLKSLSRAQKRKPRPGVPEFPR
jgi:hypothetical protein